MIEGLNNETNESENKSMFIPNISRAMGSVIKCFEDADKPLNKSGSGEIFVKPHWVDGYTKSNGTIVDGLWRDGDKHTNVDLTEDQGGGYFRKK